MTLKCFRCGKLHGLAGDGPASYICPACQAGIEAQKDASGDAGQIMVTTAFRLTGYNIVRDLGVVRGIVVRSRSSFSSGDPAPPAVDGGDRILFAQLCEQTRSDAFDAMLEHAAELDANAIIGFRYDATEIAQGMTEVLAYGSAVFVDRKWLADSPPAGS